MKTNIFGIILLAILFMGCKEDRLEPMGHDSTPPGQVSNVGVESLPGKVKLTYTLPGDPKCRSMRSTEARSPLTR